MNISKLENPDSNFPTKIAHVLCGVEFIKKLFHRHALFEQNFKIFSQKNKKTMTDIIQDILK